MGRNNDGNVKVYWGVTRREYFPEFTKVIPAQEPVLISAGNIWNNRKKKWRDLASRPWDDFILDSGGFTALAQYGTYPFTPGEYLDLVARMNPPRAASMDYVCLEDVTPLCLMSVRERIEATADLAHYLCAADSRVFPVMQGVTLDDFAYSWASIATLAPSFVGVGSLARRQGENDFVGLVRGLREIIPDGVWVHGFGVKVKALRQGPVCQLFDSIDTIAWQFMMNSRWKPWPTDVLFRRYQEMMTRTLAKIYQGEIL